MTGFGERATPLPAAQDRERDLPWEDRTAERTVQVTAEMIDRFVELSSDHSAIHVSDEAARAYGFRGRVAHGMLVGSLVSGLIGTELPGDCGVLQEVKLSFRNPCYAGDTLHIHLKVREFFASVQSLILTVSIRNQDGLTIATGNVQSGIKSQS